MITLQIGGNTKRSKFQPKEVSIDWAKLPEASQDFLIRYGLKQYLADGTAGEETQAAFEAQIEARMERLAKADFTRTRGEASVKTDTEALRATKLVRDDIRKRIKAAGLEGVSKDKVAELVAAIMGDETKSAPFRQEAKRQLESEAKLAQATPDDLLKDLL